MTAAQSGAPTSSLERDARRTNEAHAGEVRPGDIAIGVIIGRTSEFFDFFVYAIASVVVFPKLIFPYVDALTGTLYSFAIFALAFVARPFGTVIFTAIDRTYGRGMKLTVALFLLGTLDGRDRLPAPATKTSALRPLICSRCFASARAWRSAARGTVWRRCWH